VQKKIEEEKMEEMIKKREYIQKIQAMEKLTNQRAKRPREFDFTETSGLGQNV